MAVYAYEAHGTGGTMVSGSIAADTPRSARDALRARGLRVAALRERRAARSVVRPHWNLHRRDEQKVLSFIREMATLLSVGTPLLDALDTCLRQHRRGRFRSTLLLLRDRVAAGSSLSDAMSQQGRTFDDLCLNITQVGEEAGTLDTSLEKLAEFKERSQQLKGKVSNALIYPGIVVVMAVSVSTFLMSSVVPTILQPLIEMGRPLPLATRIVKTASDGLIAWGWLIALAIMTLAISFAAVLRTHRGQKVWHTLLLKVPLLGPLLRKQAIVRICIIISALLGSGVEFVRALQIARRATRNQVLKGALEKCEHAITAGSDVGGALENTEAFPPLVVQVFAVGQQSGRMEQMLARLASDYDKDVTTAAQRLSALLEPLLIVLLALLVLLIAMATMLPILEAGDVLQ